MTEYIVVGDTKEYDSCLIYACGTKDHAETVLDRMLTDPNDEDIRIMKTHFNLRIKTVEEKDQWWNDPFLAN